VKPRYKPTWITDEANSEVFIGHVGPLDIYYEHNKTEKEHWIIVVGPDERKRNGNGAHNFDVYDIEKGKMVPHMAGAVDIHIELIEMCEIYALAIKLGYMEEE
jgi:hypothetical protein